jgi:hypothetical protein
MPELKDSTNYLIILSINKPNSDTFGVIGNRSKKIYHEGLYLNCIYALRDNHEAWEKGEMNLKEK